MRRLVVEADGGSRGNPGLAAFGAVVRSADTGQVLAEVGETIGVATNNVAEYQGLVHGLRLASAIDPLAEVEARLDSKLVVEQMSGRWKIKHADLRPLALEAQRIFPPGHVTYTWVPRAQNAYADRLLNDALDGDPVEMPSPGQLAAAGEPEDAAPWLPTEPEPFAPKAPEEAPEAAEAPEEPAATRPQTHAGPMPWSPEYGPPTTLVLVRHGQTAMTVARTFSGGGTEGPALDDTGREQADSAGLALAGWELLDGVTPTVVASPMLRSRQTADAVAARLGVEKVTLDEQWRECEFGVWDGLTLADITERFPDDVAGWLASTSVRAPGGESIDEMTTRVAAARDLLVGEHPGEVVVVVTHSMPIRALVRLAMDAPPAAMFRMQPRPGSVTEIAYFGADAVALTSFNYRPEKR